MNPGDIQVGKTYERAGGQRSWADEVDRWSKRRTVVDLRPSTAVGTWVEYTESGNGSGTSLEAFARWAQREVSGEEVARG